MADNLVNEIIELYKQNKWREIINKYHDHCERNKLLWVFPSEENLRFLKEVFSELGCDRALSIGCGSGLLEWIITEATGIQMRGVEVDGAWWNCRYSPPKFIPLLLTEDGTLHPETIAELHQTPCLLFCYFNNRPAFNNYIKYFNGSVIIIIGPGQGKGVHADPLPFDDFGKDWKLYKWQEVRQSKDFISVYNKCLF